MPICTARSTARSPAASRLSLDALHKHANGLLQLLGLGQVVGVAVRRDGQRTSQRRACSVHDIGRRHCICSFEGGGMCAHVCECVPPLHCLTPSLPHPLTHPTHSLTNLVAELDEGGDVLPWVGPLACELLGKHRRRLELQQHRALQLVARALDICLRHLCCRKKQGLAQNRHRLCRLLVVVVGRASLQHAFRCVCVCMCVSVCLCVCVCVSLSVSLNLSLSLSLLTSLNLSLSLSISLSLSLDLSLCACTSTHHVWMCRRLQRENACVSKCHVLCLCTLHPRKLVQAVAVQPRVQPFAGPCSAGTGWWGGAWSAGL